MDKSIFRSECLKKRKELPKRSASLSLFRDDERFKKAQVVFLYISYSSEIDTHILLDELLKEKTVVVPYCVDMDGNMIAVKIESIDELKKGSYGIPEPENPIEFDKSKIDCVIMPGVCFSQNGTRLGYGKGYYDRFLSDINPYKIGLCHKELLFPSIPNESHDAVADKIITL